MAHFHTPPDLVVDAVVNPRGPLAPPVRRDAAQLAFQLAANRPPVERGHHKLGGT